MMSHTTWEEALAALAAEWNRELKEISDDSAHGEECRHAWHCERCGMDGPGMGELRDEWDREDGVLRPSWGSR